MTRDESVVPSIEHDSHLGQLAKDAFLSLEQLQQSLIDCQEQLRALGFENVTMINGPICDASGHPFFTPVDVLRAGVPEKKFIVIEFTDSEIVYRFHDTEILLAKSKLSSEGQGIFLLEKSRTTKIVKSRPAYMYPELFQLPPEEVWPQSSDIAVIGDPDAAIDRERVTIVEYEYADEIFPPALQERLTAGSSEHLVEYYDNWYLQLFREDMEALERIYSAFTRDDNPYWLAARTAISRFGDLYQFVASPNGIINSLDYLRLEIKELQSILEDLATGDWSVGQFTNPDSVVRMEDNDDLQTFFEFKQRVLEKLGNPEAWSEFIRRWTKYLEGLPHNRLRECIDNYEKNLEQAKHWLRTLPTAKSSERATRGLRFLDNFYDQIRQFPTPNTSSWEDPIYSSEIEDALATGIMSDGAFGYFIPGHPINFRTKKFLQKLSRQLGNMLDYAENVIPILDAERDRLIGLDIPASPSALFAWLRPLEQQLIRERYFIKPTEKAVATHGFFPYDVRLDPQDRIVALTSVTMHGWNALDKAGFQSDIETSLQYLKIGGKYILGPINQRVYFTGYNDGFDCDGLAQALHTLQQRGLIRYYFVKGRKHREHDGYDDRVDYGTDQDVGANNQVLQPSESAHSLVIERLH
jgi:hypothetical protein